ncbi:GntR family transcriptional regulator [Bradyrhizobium viridifuturi]|uniref:GntR family transcriptional regulator n=1 Tax=Bradyrhizobium viridifuturi TaxID=1654716 RepID=UPI001FCCEB61|nr:GntR family transcriptional regulator [Bradyrhizobium viridifuturi]
MSIPRAKSQTRRKQPAYALIKSALAKHIRAGDVPPGTVLSESAIATLFGSSRSPVRQAFEQLEHVGWCAGSTAAASSPASARSSHGASRSRRRCLD